MSSRSPLAIVTMTYNEGDLVSVWRRHYAAQVGDARCYVIDHGSTDGSVSDLGDVNVVRIPRSPQDDKMRAGFLSCFCASLLCWYDAVVYVDIDELLVADPARYNSLLSYAASVERDGIRTAIGFDVIHPSSEEPTMDWSRPVSEQRRWLRFSSAMCKPVLIRQPVSWAPGFHCIDAPPRFDNLYLFHLRYADRDAGLARLARTRTQPWKRHDAGMHQRMADDRWDAMLSGMAGLERRDDIVLGENDPALREWLARVMESAKSRTEELYKIDLHLSGDALWRLPDRFVGTF